MVESKARSVKVRKLSNLCAVFAQETYELGPGVAVVVAVAFVAADELVPYSAEPILNSHLANSLHPYQQRPLGSYTEGSPHSEMSLAYLAQSSVALDVMIPV
jgi:hypothetical protein